MTDIMDEILRGQRCYLCGEHLLGERLEGSHPFEVYGTYVRICDGCHEARKRMVRGNND